MVMLPRWQNDILEGCDTIDLTQLPHFIIHG